MKEEVVVSDMAFDEKERLCLVSIVYAKEGHQLFRASFIPCYYGTMRVEVTEKNPPIHIPDDIFLLMCNKAIEEFKKEGIFLLQDKNALQAELPLGEQDTN